jgi:hypothetical protein
MDSQLSAHVGQLESICLDTSLGQSIKNKTFNTWQRLITPVEFSLLVLMAFIHRDGVSEGEGAVQVFKVHWVGENIQKTAHIQKHLTRRTKP